MINKIKENAKSLVILVLAFVFSVGAVSAYSGSAQTVVEGNMIVNGCEKELGGLNEYEDLVFINGYRVGYNQTRVMDSSGNFTIPGTLTVTGATTLTGAITFTGAGSFSSTLGVTGATTLSSTLAVSATSTMASTTIVGDLTQTIGDVNFDANTLVVDASTNRVGVASATPGFALGVVGTTGITGNTTVGGTLTVTGAATLSSTLGYKELSERVAAANTLTASESGLVTYITAGATTTLPAVSTATGTIFRFVIASAITTDAHIASAEGDNIEGSLIVAGAVVDCNATDDISFISDGENLGDYVEVRSDGQKWFVTLSNALTAAKLTCEG